MSYGVSYPDLYRRVAAYEGNWSWRYTEEMMSAADFDSLPELTKSSNRLSTLRRYGKLEETL